LLLIRRPSNEPGGPVAADDVLALIDLDGGATPGTTDGAEDL